MNLHHLSHAIFIQPIIYMLYVCRSYTFIYSYRTKKRKNEIYGSFSHSGKYIKYH